MYGSRPPPPRPHGKIVFLPLKSMPCACWSPGLLFYPPSPCLFQAPPGPFFFPTSYFTPAVLPLSNLTWSLLVSLFARSFISPLLPVGLHFRRVISVLLMSVSFLFASLFFAWAQFSILYAASDVPYLCQFSSSFLFLLKD